MKYIMIYRWHKYENILKNITKIIWSIPVCCGSIHFHNVIKFSAYSAVPGVFNLIIIHIIINVIIRFYVSLYHFVSFGYMRMPLALLAVESRLFLLSLHLKIILYKTILTNISNIWHFTKENTFIIRINTFHAMNIFVLNSLRYYLQAFFYLLMHFIYFIFFTHYTHLHWHNSSTFVHAVFQTLFFICSFIILFILVTLAFVFVIMLVCLFDSTVQNIYWNLWTI